MTRTLKPIPVGLAAVAAVAAALAVMLAAAPSASAQQMITDPMLPESAVRQVSPHVYVIMGFPNIGFVVGDRATLVIDTGVGRRNGALVARAARKLSTRGQRLYLTTTHFHPEHASGQIGFPPDTVVIRNRVQQQELDAGGAQLDALFASRSPVMRRLLQGVTVGNADILFDKELDLDLGGVHARLLYFGAAHTRGDELTYVPEDRVLLPGDVVQNRLSPNVSCNTCSPRQWIAVLDKVAPLQPKLIVPDHGQLGGGELIAQERAFLVDLQTRALALKAQGLSAARAGQQIETEFKARYAGWQSLGNLPRSVQRVYDDHP